MIAGTFLATEGASSGSPKARIPALQVRRSGVLLALLVLGATFAVVYSLPLYYNTRVVLLTTGLLGASSGLVGALAVLRRRALLGDALAHAALPGLCLAFILAGSRGLPILLAGALASGLVGTICIALLRRGTRVKDDAAIGIVLSVFFGAGIVLSRIIQNHVAEASRAGLDRYIFGQAAGIILSDLAWIAGLSLAVAAAVAVLFKEFMVTGFDHEFAAAQGWPVTWLDLLLLFLIAVTVIIGLPAVGVVMMAALLILPAAAGRFWTDRLDSLLALAAVFGAAIGLIGTAVSAQVAKLPTGPLIVLTGTVLFLVSASVAPSRGLISQWWRLRGYRQRVAQQQMLLALQKVVALQAAPGMPLDSGSLARAAGMPGRTLRRAIRLARKRGWLRVGFEGSLELTATGQEAARRIVEAREIFLRYARDDPEGATRTADLDLFAALSNIPNSSRFTSKGSMSGGQPSGADSP